MAGGDKGAGRGCLEGSKWKAASSVVGGGGEERGEEEEEEAGKKKSGSAEGMREVEGLE